MGSGSTKTADASDGVSKIASDAIHLKSLSKAAKEKVRSNGNLILKKVDRTSSIYLQALLVTALFHFL
jgi:hypothetical protein